MKLRTYRRISTLYFLTASSVSYRFSGRFFIAISSNSALTALTGTSMLWLFSHCIIYSFRHDRFGGIVSLVRRLCQGALSIIKTILLYFPKLKRNERNRKNDHYRILFEEDKRYDRSMSKNVMSSYDVLQWTQRYQ